MAHSPTLNVGWKWSLGPLDCMVGLVAPFAACFIREFGFNENEWNCLLLYGAASWIATAIAVAHFKIARILPRYLSMHDLHNIIKCSAFAVAVTVVVFSLTKLCGLPRSIPVLHFMTLCGMLVTMRVLISQFQRWRDGFQLSGNRFPTESIIVVGANYLTWLYIRLNDLQRQNRPRIVAILDENKQLHGRSLCGHLVAGGMNAAESIIDEYALHGVFVDRILIAARNEPEWRRTVQQLSALDTARKVPVESLNERLTDYHIPANDDSAASVYVVADRLPNARYWKLRRAADIVFAGIALAVSFPMAAFVALIVFADVGVPILFWQERIGLNGRRICVYKFRTLRPGSRGQAPHPSKVGDFLRRTRLDEIPQLYNVLKGEMTLIGPRPLLPVDQPFDPTIRLTVPPGLTGWAQVHGGRLIGSEEKNALDEWYIRHCSFSIDVKVVFLTISSLLYGDRHDCGAVNLALHEQALLRSALVQNLEKAAA